MNGRQPLVDLSQQYSYNPSSSFHLVEPIATFLLVLQANQFQLTSPHEGCLPAGRLALAQSAPSCGPGTIAMDKHGNKQRHAKPKSKQGWPGNIFSSSWTAFSNEGAFAQPYNMRLLAGVLHFRHSCPTKTHAYVSFGRSRSFSASVLLLLCLKDHPGHDTGLHSGIGVSDTSSPPTLWAVARAAQKELQSGLVCTLIQQHCHELLGQDAAAAFSINRVRSIHPACMWPSCLQDKLDA